MLYIIDQPLVQGVTWVLVYRTEKYIKLKSEIEKQSKKLEKKKEAHGEAANLDRSKKRKLEAVSNLDILSPSLFNANHFL